MNQICTLDFNKLIELNSPNQIYKTESTKSNKTSKVFEM